MPKLELLCIHCTATPEGRPVLPDDIRKWHLSPVSEGGRGWRQVGYSDMILIGGELVNLVKYNDDDNVDAWEITNGATGINQKTRHVVYAGGTDNQMKPKDTRNAAQLETLKKYVFSTIRKHKNIKVCGHNQFATKACPSFDTVSWLMSIGVEDKNIYRK